MLKKGSILQIIEIPLPKGIEQKGYWLNERRIR